MRKVTRRLIPFLFLLYIVAYLDRVNVGFAQLQMKGALGFDEVVYGFGAGVFFVGYFLFEIPSNLILERVGARVWIARIMVVWGLVAAAMMFVRGPLSFYTLRFLLGVGEAGFFPGIILYLTYWFPAAERARAVSLFMTATALAGVVGGPASGALLSLNGAGGLAGWQWLFLVEGIPAVVLGVVVLVYLTDRPESARWLKAGERDWLSGELKAERERQHEGHARTLPQALKSFRVWLLGLVYFSIILGFYSISLWLPVIVKGFTGLSDFQVGLVSALPYVVAAAGMIFIGAHSDRTGERRWHVALPAVAGGAALLLAAYFHNPLLVLLSLCVAALGIWGALGPFWTLPASFLRGSAAAGGIAVINSIGNLGGFVGPYLVGFVKRSTGSFSGGLVVLALFLFFGAGLVLATQRESEGKLRA
ncbi:MAG TPA: MFS transporter [Pyrinomonadaceae bacterium]|jgi:ACS family tartrate transporter-like MFS transporter